MDDVQPLFSEATALFAAHDWQGAEQRLHLALARAPDHVPSLSLLGLIAGRDGRDAQCVALLDEAISLSDGAQAAAGGVLLGAAHRRAGRLEKAEAAYRRAAEADPSSPEAALQLGLLLHAQARHHEALSALRAASELDPGLSVAHGALGAALYALGNVTQAADHAERALALAPHDRAFAANLAVVRNAQGRFAEAVQLCRSLLMTGEEPSLLVTLGVALKELGDLQGAGASLERALAISPGLAPALYNLAAVRKDEGRTDEAVELFRRLVALQPDLAAARFALCMAHLPPLYADQEEIARRRRDYAAELAALEVFAEQVGYAALAPGVGAAQPFYLAYQGQNDRDLQRRYGELVCRALGAAFEPAPLAEPPKAGERLRLGIISGHLRDHSVWRIPTRGWADGFDPALFEIAAFHTGSVWDAETERARQVFESFMQGPMSLEAWRRAIIEFRPHALIYPEVGMDPMVAQLAGLRLAPAQYASWGHPSTSGYPTIDFFISSEAMEPPGAEAHYSETLVRLPGLSTTISLPVIGEPPPRARLGLPDAAVVFWCAQALYKYLPQHDEVFAEIASRVAGCKFVFMEFPGSAALTQRFKDRLARAFARHGLDAQSFIVVSPQMEAKTFRAAMGCADVMLDPIGWSGCNSVADALAWGLAIVTMPGDTMRSRHAAAMLRAIGQEALVCETQGAYIAAAIGLATDLRARQEIGKSIQAGVSQLNGVGAVRALERHLIEAVTGSPTRR